MKTIRQKGKLLRKKQEIILKSRFYSGSDTCYYWSFCVVFVCLFYVRFSFLLLVLVGFFNVKFVTEIVK